MIHKIFILLFTVPLLLVYSGIAMAHCEIPCGIYDDSARINMLMEHVTTLEKSMTQIISLEKAEQKNSNQLIRWVLNKEEHANQFQEIVSQYFLTQRIKKTDSDYTEKLELLHQMLVYGMKSKQTTNLDYIKTLRDLIHQFETVYFKK